MADLYKGEVYIAPPGTEPGEGSRTHIGETAGLFELGFQHQIPAPDLMPFGRLASLTVSLTIDVGDFTAKVSEAWRWLHDLDRRCHPRRHRRCHICHPKWSRPLAVNGHEYQRRQRARARRKNR